MIIKLFIATLFVLTTVPSFGQTDNDKKLIDAMYATSGEHGEAIWTVLHNFKSKIAAGLVKEGLSQSVANQLGIDSALATMFKYYSFNGAYLNSLKGKNPALDTRKHFVDSLCQSNSMERYCPTLDSLFMVRAAQIDMLRKSIVEK